METQQITLEPVDINTVGAGALPDLFNDDMKLVLKDIQNPNKVKESVRTITLKITIKPDKTSDNISVSCTSRASLGTREEIGDVMYVHNDKFVRNDVHQLELPGMDPISMVRPPVHSAAMPPQTKVHTPRKRASKKVDKKQTPPPADESTTDSAVSNA